MEKLTAIYQDFTQIDPILLRYAQGKIALLKGDYAQAIQHFQTILAKQPKLNTVRIELAIALLYDQQLNQAQAQFEKAKSAEHLPPKVHALIEQYQQHLAKKQEWKFSFSANYVRDGNINRTSKQPNIEQTGYVKQPNLLPQTAHGVHYAFGLQRDFNLFDSHYVSFDNQTQGELYWDNHDYDEITKRTLFGYAYKNPTKPPACYRFMKNAGNITVRNAGQTEFDLNTHNGFHRIGNSPPHWNTAKNVILICRFITAATNLPLPHCFGYAIHNNFSLSALISIKTKLS